MFGAPRKPDSKKAMKELKTNAIMFGTLVAVLRIAPYIFHVAQKATSK